MVKGNFLLVFPSVDKLVQGAGRTDQSKGLLFNRFSA